MIYDNTFDEFNKGNIVWRRIGGSPIYAVLVDTTVYTPRRAHQYLDRIPLNARVGLPRRLILNDMSNSVCDAEDIPFTGLIKRQTVGGIAIFKDCGEDGNSPLLAWVDIEGDPVEVFQVAYVRWPDTGIFTMRMTGSIAAMEAARIPFTGAEWLTNDAANKARIVSGKLEVWNVYGKVPQFPHRPEVEPWIPPYLPTCPPDRWKIEPLVGESPEDMGKPGYPLPFVYPFHGPVKPPFFPLHFRNPQPWRPDDWSPQDDRYPVPFPVKPDWMRPGPIPPHFNPKIEGEWGTAFESKPWLGPRPPLVPVIPEGQEFFHDNMNIVIRRGASAEIRIYIADAHDHLIHHIGEVNRDVTFHMKRMTFDGSEQTLTLNDKIVFLPVIPGEPVVIQLDQEETLTCGKHAFELVLHVGQKKTVGNKEIAEDRYIAAHGIIHIAPAFGTIGDAEPKKIFPDLIYVRDYGAVGDGETDDTQAFVDAAEAAGDTGAVYVHAGEYCLSHDVKGRFIALGKVTFTCAGEAPVTDLRDDFVHLEGDEEINGVKTFNDTPVFSSGIAVADGGITVASGGATIHGGMTVTGGYISGTATSAISAGHATSAGYAVSAGYADSAGDAGHAALADSATDATSAGSAGSAGYATSAGKATSATSAGTAGTADSIGSATVGGIAHPIYWSEGQPTACTATVGGVAQPVYMSSGTIKAITGNIGDPTTPVYVSGGVLTPCSSGGGSGGSGGEEALLQRYNLYAGSFTVSSGCVVGSVFLPEASGGRKYFVRLANAVYSTSYNPDEGQFSYGTRDVFYNNQSPGAQLSNACVVMGLGNAITATSICDSITSQYGSARITFTELIRHVYSSADRHFACGYKMSGTMLDGFTLQTDCGSLLESYCVYNGGQIKHT